MNYRFLFFAFLLFLASCKNTQKAGGTTKKLSDEQEMNFTFHFVEGNREKILGNAGNAFIHFDKCIKIDPLCATCYYEIAGILASQQQLKEAIVYSKKAVDLDGQNKWLLLFYADLTLEAKQFEESAAAFQKLIKLHPNVLEYSFNLAEVYIEQNKYEKAIEVYNKVEEKMGVTEEISLQKFKLYAALRNEENAINELQKLIAAQPKEIKFLQELADYLQEIGREEEALKTYERMLKVNPSNASAHLSLANYYRKKNNNDKSFYHLGMAFENPEMSIDSKVQLLLNYYTISKDDSVMSKKVYKLLDAMERAHPENAKTYAVYGDFYYRDNIYTKALEKFKKSTALEADKYLVWRNILTIELETKQYDSLLIDCDKALEYFPAQPEIFWYKGVAAVQLKQTNKAIDAFTSGVELVAGNDKFKAQFYSSLGDLYNEQKKYKESDDNYDQALTHDPDNIYVLNNYAYYLSLRKENLNKAAEMSKRSNALSPNNASFEDTFGWILFQENNFGEAVKWLLKAEEHGGGDSGTVLEHIGDAYYKLGDKNKALEYWKKAKNAGKDVSSQLEQKISQQKYFE